MDVYGPCSATRVQVYGATHGRPSAAARCSGPVSLATITSRERQQRGEPRERGLAGEVAAPGRGAARSPRCDSAVSSPVPTNTHVPPKCDCARFSSSAKCAGGQRFVTHFAPTATATHGRGKSGELVARRVHFGRIERHVEPLRHVARAERLGDAPVAIDGVDAVGVRHADLVRVGVAAAFAGVREPDATRRTGGEAHQPGAQQPLQVDDEIEPPAAQFARERDA